MAHQVNYYDWLGFMFAQNKVLSMDYRTFGVEMVQSSKVINIDNLYFVIKEEDFSKLTEEHLDALVTLSHDEDVGLRNPIFTELDEEGRLVVD